MPFRGACAILPLSLAFPRLFSPSPLGRPHWLPGLNSTGIIPSFAWNVNSFYFVWPSLLSPSCFSVCLILIAVLNVGSWCHFTLALLFPLPCNCHVFLYIAFLLLHYQTVTAATTHQFSRIVSFTKIVLSPFLTSVSQGLEHCQALCRLVCLGGWVERKQVEKSAPRALALCRLCGIR